MSTSTTWSSTSTEVADLERLDDHLVVRVIEVVRLDSAATSGSSSESPMESK